MKKSGFLSFLGILVASAGLIWALAGAQEDPQNGAGATIIAGRNVNMVSGTTLPGGDPWLQRQNEPSIAVSTRNPLHLLAGANDYRTVDMPFSEGELPGVSGAAAGDAWLGIYKSFDGGETWRTGLLPGYPQDSISQSPLKAYTTAADPIVRAGTNGLFYYSGMAFNRNVKGGGAFFLARFIDNNNDETGDPIKYLDTRFIDQGTPGQFIDMPRIAVDKPNGLGTVMIDGQAIPRSNIYAAYTVFLGNLDVNVRSRIMFRRSTDCGATWGPATKLSESQHIIQGAVIAIDPVSGAVYVAFRRFAHGNDGDAIVIVESTDGGQSFSNPYVVASISPFDQPATDVLTAPAGPSFRTNSYPTMTVDNGGIIYVAWTERNRGPNNEARIVLATSQGGSSWNGPTVVDLPPGQGIPYLGHQFMPFLTFSQGDLVMTCFDQRNDVCSNAYGFGPWISDDQPVRHTIDVRAAKAEPGLFPTFQPSVQVSRYLWAFDEATQSLFQAQHNPPNYELFKGGTVPFHGDYIELSGSPVFIQDEDGEWVFNTAAADSSVYHAVWTDNRDVRPGNWTNYTPPSSNQGVFGSKDCASVTLENMGTRNQNIYTSRLVEGIDAASPANAKPLGNDFGVYGGDLGGGYIPRTFVIYVRNPTGVSKSFRMEIIEEPASGGASFTEFDDLDSLEVMIAPYSMISRTVFVSSDDVHDFARISIYEIDTLGGIPVPDGLTADITLNPDPTNPPPDGTIDPEIHNPNIVNPNIVNWTEVPNPNIVNPNIVNPNIVNPNIVNPNIVNPNIVNPNIVNYANPNIVNPNIVNPNIVNPNIVNPNIVNPNIVNPNIVNPNIVNMSEGAEVADVVFQIINEGNTISSYSLKMYSKESLPDGIYAQLLVYRVSYTPAGDEDGLTGLSACELKEERHHDLLLNIVNPNIVNPNIVNPNIVNPNIVNGAIENATFTVGPGEEVEASLRVIDPNPSQIRFLQSGLPFDLQTFVESLGFAATAHAVNTEDAQNGIGIPPADATKLVIGTPSLPDGVVGQTYMATLVAYGGGGYYAWSLNSGQLPPGLVLAGSGVISGTPTQAGLHHFNVRVDDGAGDFDTQNYSLYIDADGIADPLAVSTTSLPSGVLEHWYGATIEAVGGVWPRVWSLSSGSLPPGLGLDTDGVISGTIRQETGQDYPTSYPFSVTVRDKAGSTATAALLIDVNAFIGNVTISGTVYDEGGNPLDGVIMRGLPGTPITGETGTAGLYTATVPAPWSGTVEPFKVGTSFTPQSRTYTAILGDQPGQNYNQPFMLPVSEEWSAGYDGPGNFLDGANDVVVAPLSGNVYVAGYTAQSQTADDGAVFKYDGSGTRLWTATWAGSEQNTDNFRHIALDSAENIYVAGYTRDWQMNSNSGMDIVVVKFDSNGNKLWEQTYDNGFADFDADMAIVESGGAVSVYVLGNTWSTGTLTDFVTIKYDGATGAKIWEAKYDNPLISDSDDVPSALAVREVSGIVHIAATGYHRPGANTSLPDFQTIKYRDDGSFASLVWSESHDYHGGNDRATAIDMDDAGIVYVTGFSNLGTVDYATIKYGTDDGAFLWARYYDGGFGGPDRPVAIVWDQFNGDVVVTGRSSNGADFDFATIRYTSSGALRWESTIPPLDPGDRRYDGPGNGDDYVYGLAVDNFGDVIVTGTCFVGPDENDYDIVTLEYRNMDGRWSPPVPYAGPAGGDDTATAVIADPATDGDFYVAGVSQGDAGDFDLILLKYLNDHSQDGAAWRSMYQGPGFNSDVVTAMGFDPAGNIYLAGRSTRNEYGRGPQYDLTVAKFDPSGAEIWVQRYESRIPNYIWNSYPVDIAVDASGVYVTGHTSTDLAQGEDYLTVAYDLDGNLKWVSSYDGPAHGDDLATGITIDATGVYVTGKSAGIGTGFDVATLKYDKDDGNPLWTSLNPEGVHRFDAGQNEDDVPRFVKLDSRGQLWIPGSFRYFPGDGDDLCCLGLDPATGAEIYFGGNSYGTQLTVTDLVIFEEPTWVHAYVAAFGTLGNPITGFDFILHAFDKEYPVPGAAGNGWIGQYDYAGFWDGAFAISSDSSGNAFTTGRSDVDGGPLPLSDIATLKFQPGSHVPVWIRRYDGPIGEQDIGYDIAVDAAGNVYVTGVSDGPGTSFDCVTLKYSTSGSPLWLVRYNGPGNHDDSGHHIAVDATGNVYVAGYRTGSGTGKDFLLLKYR